MAGYRIDKVHITDELISFLTWVIYNLRLSGVEALPEYYAQAFIGYDHCSGPDRTVSS